ncbi:MAG: hypothetical protein PVH61_29805 [Candidatus Aminicenantes bacterium]|jgi:hypothetical protein
MKILMVFITVIALLPVNCTKKESIQAKIDRLLTESDKIENYDKWAQQHKKEILSWSNKGIKYLLHYPLGFLDNVERRKKEHAIMACLDIFGKKALPQLKKALDDQLNPSFEIAMQAYFKIEQKFPEEEKYLLKKLNDWYSTDKKKFFYASEYLLYPGILWREEKQQKILDHFSQYFFEEKRLRVNIDLIFWGNWLYFDDILNSNIIPFLSYLVLEFFKEEEGICFSTFYRVFDYISTDLPNRKRFEQSIHPEQKKENDSSLGRTLYNNDLRMFPHVLQEIYTTQLEKNLFNLFPQDRDEEAVTFLKNYLYTKRDFKWIDAACILANYLSKDECAKLGRELTAKNRQKRGDYLVKLSETGCSIFEETVNKRRRGKVLLPGLWSRMPDYHDISDDLLGFLKRKVYRFKDTICSEGEACISRLKVLAETGSVFKQITALEWLSSFAAVSNDFFMEKLKLHENTWIKAVCLWILKKRNADIPGPIIWKSLHDKNPFLVFLVVGMADKLQKPDLEKCLEQLFIEGDTLYQKEVLKKIYECFGYQKAKTYFSKPRKGKMSILAEIFFLQKAFENKDIEVLTGYFHLDSRPELLCPAAVALFELEKEKTVKKIISFFTGGLDHLREKTRQKQLTKPGFKTIVKTFISILGQSKNKHAIPILLKFSKIDDFELISRTALVNFIPIMKPAELEEFQKKLSPYCMSIYISQHPKYQNWIYNYFKKNPQHIPIEYVIERELQPLFPIIRPLILKKGLYRYADEIKKLNPGWARQEFLWYLEKGNRRDSLTALRQLVDFPPSEKIDAIMKEKFLGPDEDEKDIACQYFARQGKDFVFQYLMQKINNRKRIRYFIEYLKYYPDEKGLKAVMELIEDRVFQVWLDLDEILREFSKKIPDQLKQYIYHQDIEVRKKIIAAFRERHPAVENGDELKQLIKHPDISLAIWAFDTYKDYFKKEDFNQLKSFYQRLKSDSIKIEVLEVISTFKSGEAAAFLQEKSKTEKYIGEYAAYYSLFHDADSLVYFLKKTTRPDLLKSALERLIKIDKSKGLYMVLDLYINFDKEVSRFKSEKEKSLFLEKIRKYSTVSPQSPVALKKSKPIKKVVFTRDIPIPPRKNNTGIRNCRSYLVGKTFFCFWQEEPDPLYCDDPKTCRIIFSDDLQKWSSPIIFAEPRQIKPYSILACDDGSYLLVYGRYPADANIHFSGHRPFFVPFDKKNGFKKGFYPLKAQQSFYNFTVFYFKGNYYIAGVPYDMIKSQNNCFEINRSSSLENWYEKPVLAQLPGEKKLYYTTISVFNDRVYMIKGEHLYESTDGIVWKRICRLLNFSFVQLLKGEGSQFCAVLSSRKYGSYESYVTFSSDLIHWSTPQYTGLPVSDNYAFYEKKFLELDGTTIRAIHLKDIEKDSDNDGLKDREEEVLLTDANNPDTDGDGIDDFKDFDPIRKAIQHPSESMRVREMVIKEFFSKKRVSHRGDLLIIVSESEETQTFDNPKFRILSFNPAEYKRYVDRFNTRKEGFFHIRFDKIEFSPDKKSVEVEFSYFPTSFTGDGHRMRLRKVNDEWVVVSHESTWIS